MILGKWISFFHREASPNRIYPTAKMQRRRHRAIKPRQQKTAKKSPCVKQGDKYVCRQKRPNVFRRHYPIEAKRRTVPKSVPVSITARLPTPDPFSCRISPAGCFRKPSRIAPMAHGGVLSVYGGLVPLGYSHSDSCDLVGILSHLLRKCNGFICNFRLGFILQSMPLRCR